MKLFVIFFSLFLSSGFLSAQFLDLRFEKIKEYTFPQFIEVWNIDNLGNVYLIQGNILIKCDSTGKQTYSQSVKSLGEISEIETINAMKIVLFSEEQQCICFVDNTLTINGNCKYLDDFEVKNAKFIATSNRPNLIWVYDEFKSTLLLIDIVKDKILQRVENLRGIIETKAEFIEMTEKDNYLYLTTSDGLVYEFDQLLSETGNVYTGFEKMWKANHKILVSRIQDSIVFRDVLKDKTQRLESPEIDVIDFKIQGDFFYFRSLKKISKYSVN